MLDAPRALVWKAWTDPEHLKRWWAPRPYETPEVRDGPAARRHLPHPDDRARTASTPARQAGCFLEMVEGEKMVWTSALGPRLPARPRCGEGCGAFPFTAIVTFEDAGDGKTRYRAVAMHRNAADRDTHEKMGFHDGWGTCADQLEELARGNGLNPSSCRSAATKQSSGAGLWIASLCSQ